MLRLEPMFRATITLAPPQELGEAPLGRRRIIPISGGRVEGPPLKGRALPVGTGARRGAAVELEFFEAL